MHKKDYHIAAGRQSGGIITPVSPACPDASLSCRCEDITIGEIREAIRGGCRTPLAVKRSARVGMGICQGRTCASFLYEMIAAHTGVPVSGQEVLSVRSPVKALGLGTLARPLERF